jgi:hypothetical protein
MDDARESADVYDKYIGSKFALPGDGGMNQMAKAVKRLKGNNRNPIGTGNYNPLLNCKVCVWFF